MRHYPGQRNLNYIDSKHIQLSAMYAKCYHSHLGESIGKIKCVIIYFITEMICINRASYYTSVESCVGYCLVSKIQHLF